MADDEIILFLFWLSKYILVTYLCSFWSNGAFIKVGELELAKTLCDASSKRVLCSFSIADRKMHDIVHIVLGPPSCSRKSL